MSAATETVAPRPPRSVRWANTVMTWMLRRGAGPPFLRLLTVDGRISHQPRTTPVAPVTRDGHVWIVAPYGTVAWVRNVRASQRVELRRGREQQSYHARELEPADAVPVLRAYLSMPTERFVRSQFDITSTSSDDAVIADALHHPVFALTPLASSDGGDVGSDGA